MRTTTSPPLGDGHSQNGWLGRLRHRLPGEERGEGELLRADEAWDDRRQKDGTSTSQLSTREWLRLLLRCRQRMVVGGRLGRLAGDAGVRGLSVRARAKCLFSLL